MILFWLRLSNARRRRFYMSVRFHLVTMATRRPKSHVCRLLLVRPKPCCHDDGAAAVLLRGADCVLSCVLARVEAPPSRPLQDQSAALWWKTVPLSNVPAAFCAFRRRSGPDAGGGAGPTPEPPATPQLSTQPSCATRFHLSVDLSLDARDKLLLLFL